MTISYRVNERVEFLFLIAVVFLISLMVTDDVRSQQIHLNEVMSLNSSTIADEDGNYGDWIEIYNSGDIPISLEGFGLSDNYDNPFKWVFPDIILDDGSFMLIWATNKDRAIPGSELHTNYAISAAGEEVILTHPDGTRIDELEPLEFPTDISIGRKPDGTGAWVFFDEPTPGISNTTDALGELLEPPVFSHKPGFYAEEFNLEITHPQEGVEIYYTLDGSEPTRESTLYVGPLEIRDRTPEQNSISMIPTNNITSGNRRWRPPTGILRKGTVIRTMVYKPELKPVSSTATFFVFPEGGQVHSLPVISITTDPDNLIDDETGIYVPGVFYQNGNPSTGNYSQRGDEWEREANFEFFDKSGESMLNQLIGIRIHGGQSRRYSHKSLRLYARNQYSESHFNYPFFSDRPDNAYKRLILRNSGNDQGFTMLRDAAGHEIAKSFNVTTQSYQPAVVYINGEYWGLHNLRERYDRHFLERVYGVDPDNIDLLTDHSSITEGDNRAYLDMLQFIDSEDLSLDENFEVLESLIDMDSFLDYFSTQIFFANTDWPHNNIDFWRSRISYNPDLPAGQDGRWRWLMYDVDFGLGLVTPSDFDMLTWVSSEQNYQNWIWPNMIMRNLLENRTFRDRLINRMGDHLNTAFLNDNTSGIVRGMASEIKPEIADYSVRWGRPSSEAAWDRFIVEMIEWLRQRRSHLYRNIREFFDISSLEEITISVNDPLLGYVEINSTILDEMTPGVKADPYPWSGTYFSGIPVTLKAYVKTKFEFLYWVVDDSIYHNRELRLYPEEVTHVQAVFDNRTKEYITPWVLNQSDYELTEWNPDEPEGSYPRSMGFVYMNETEPGISAELSGLTLGAFDLNSRTRVSGLGENGFSFINTTHPEGNTGYPGTRLGGALLIIDTSNLEQTVVSWRAGTIERNSKLYRLRLQYRTDPEQPFKDLPGHDGSPIEYVAHEENGHFSYMGPTALPDDALDEQRVELLWRYYYSGEQLDPESNRRSELSISEVYLTGNSIKPLSDPHPMNGGEYHFSNWPASSPPGSYPASMAFIFMNEREPSLIAEPLGYATGRYDLETRSRISGLGINGFSFLNTSNVEGNPGFPGRRLGGAILALNLEKQGSAKIEWSASTLQPGSRVYVMRLQYRTDADEPFRDVTDEFGAPVEYVRYPESGHHQTIGPLLLPPDTDGAPYVELFWRYYHTGIRLTDDSGYRTEIAVSDIRVTSLPLLGGEPGVPQTFRLYNNYPNPFYPNSNLRFDLPQDQYVRLDLYTITGQHIQTLIDGQRRAGRHSVLVDASSLASGIYIYRMVTDDYNSSGKLSVIK